LTQRPSNLRGAAKLAELTAQEYPITAIGNRAFDAIKRVHGTQDMDSFLSILPISKIQLIT
jgi:hypothetical protein